MWSRRQRVSVYDTSGQRLQDFATAGSPYRDGLAYDPDAHALWVAERPDLIRRYGAESGLVEWEFNVPQPPRLLAPDRHGGVWVGLGGTLLRLDAAGNEVLRLDPFSGEEGEPVTLVPDPARAGVWVASRRAVRHVGAEGEMSPVLPLTGASPEPAIRALALAAEPDAATQHDADSKADGASASGAAKAALNTANGAARKCPAAASSSLAGGAMQPLAAAALPAGSATYTYDALGRLILARYSTGANLTYHYAAAGHRTRSRVSGAPNPVDSRDLPPKKGMDSSCCDTALLLYPPSGRSEWPG